MQLHLASITSVIPFISWVTFVGMVCELSFSLMAAASSNWGQSSQISAGEKNGERDLPSLCFKTSNVSQQSDSCEIIFDFFHNAYKDQPQEMV